MKVKIEGMQNIDDIKRIGDYLFVVGSSDPEGDVTRFAFVDRQGKVVLSQEEGSFKVDKIIVNQDQKKKINLLL